MAISPEKCAKCKTLGMNRDIVSADRSLKSLHEQLMNEIIKG